MEDRREDETDPSGDAAGAIEVGRQRPRPTTRSEHDDAEDTARDDRARRHRPGDHPGRPGRLGGRGRRLRLGWGRQDDRDSIAAIHHALELGVNWIDTAAQYGFGHSEQVVGRALAGLDERPYVFTKAGQPEGPGRTTAHSLRRDSIRRELEGSLTRLGVEAIDLYQIHFPIPDEEIEEGWSTLVELRDEGLVRHIGVSNFSVAQLRRAQAIAPVETLQPQYSLIARDVEAEILPFAERAGSGDRLLADGLRNAQRGDDPRAIERLPDDDWRKQDARFREPLLSEHLALVERLKAVAERHDTTPGAVAVAWTLRNPAVDGAIVGFRRPDQVDPILAAASLDLDEDDMATIEGRT
jgi:aryl-alcohol dehydrogenase-like predicted oxidoreductase